MTHNSIMGKELFVYMKKCHQIKSYVRCASDQYENSVVTLDCVPSFKEKNVTFENF